ncbi:MAG: radical protein [Chitinophagaceae bacterium]|nr:radical protein [Chitinophagaceae bacterium]
MCDIWKSNDNIQQLNEADVEELLASLQKLHTKQVVMSGGEALLNKNFFDLCTLLKKQKIRITLLSTGILLSKYAHQLAEQVDDIIISLDGDEEIHNLIRNIPAAFSKLQAGVHAVRELQPSYKISARTVIQKMNFRKWPAIIETAKQLNLNSISFLPADVSSEAFNRSIPWGIDKQSEVMILKEELNDLREIIESIIDKNADDIDAGFISESRDKLRNIYYYYAALYGLNDFPFKSCNAPWVSAVIEADGTLRPCFFHSPMGNVKKNSLGELLNSKEAMAFRASLKDNQNEICKKCVCYLNLSPWVNPAAIN